MLLPGDLKWFSVAYWLQGLVPHALPSDSPTSLLQQIFHEPPAIWESLLVLALVTAGSLFLAARAVTNREYVLEQ
jgi:hypothetical protein